MVLVTPGIRPAGADAGDQKRIMTPAAAIAAGADYLVVGRPVIAAPDPKAAAEAIVAEIAQRDCGRRRRTHAQGLLDPAPRCEQPGGLPGLSRRWRTPPQAFGRSCWRAAAATRWSKARCAAATCCASSTPTTRRSACYRLARIPRAKPLREPARVCEFVIVEGYDGPQPPPIGTPPAAAACKGYWIAHVDVTDPEGYKAYMAANAAAFGKFGARFLVRGGRAR